MKGTFVPKEKVQIEDEVISVNVLLEMHLK